MGLFYTSFINKTIDTFNQNKEQSFEVFLDSPKMKSILSEFDISEDSLTWALNLEQIFHQLELTPITYKDRIEKPIQDNNKDWENSDMSYLTKKISKLL
jgi:hypothetical protein